MGKILIDYADGHYSTRPLSDDEASALEQQGVEVAHVEDRVLDAWHRHCDEAGTWHALWRSIANEQYVRRRERELLPLENAQREIDRLKEELDRSRRVEKFYEDAYLRNLGERHREEYVEYTCVYPQPGCKIDALPPEWHERAQEILAQYNAERAAEGMKVQGCCCGHEHRKFNEVDSIRLRDAGFLVEHDVETS